MIRVIVALDNLHVWKKFSLYLSKRIKLTKQNPFNTLVVNYRQGDPSRSDLNHKDSMNLDMISTNCKLA